MARQGVLSDLAVKYRWPEHTPLDIASQDLMHPIHLQKNIFRGIKPSKRMKRFTDVSRFPINDLKNFSQFGEPERAKEMQFNAIMNYRREVGSNNYQGNLATAFQERNKSDYVPPPTFRPPQDTGRVQTPATLTLGTGRRKEAQDAFSQAVIGSRSFLSARMRATLANIAEPSDYPTLMSYLVPGGLPTKISDEHAMEKLTKIYRDDAEQLGTIERAYHAAGTQYLRPTPMMDEGDEE